jgi:hypothetical protein
VCERRVFSHSSVEGGLVGSLCSEDISSVKDWRVLGRTFDYDGSCCHTSVVGIALCYYQGLHLYVQFICLNP